MTKRAIGYIHAYKNKIMRKTFLFYFIIIGSATYGQSNNVNVTFGKPNPIGDAMNQVQQNANANRQLQISENASFNAALADNYSNVTTDYLINNTNSYKYIVIENVSGWMEKENTKDIVKTISDSKKFTVVNTTKYYSNYKEIPNNLIGNPEVLFLNWQREAQGEYNRITRLAIKNYKGDVIYESMSKNLSFGEILKPVISNYIDTKEQALSKVEDLKKYLDLGIISKEEYNDKVTKLKVILIGE